MHFEMNEIGMVETKFFPKRWKKHFWADELGLAGHSSMIVMCLVDEKWSDYAFGSFWCLLNILGFCECFLEKFSSGFLWNSSLRIFWSSAEPFRLAKSNPEASLGIDFPFAFNFLTRKRSGRWLTPDRKVRQEISRKISIKRMAGDSTRKIRAISIYLTKWSGGEELAGRNYANILLLIVPRKSLHKYFSLI